MTLTELQAARDKALAALAKPAETRKGDVGISQREAKQLLLAIAKYDAEIAALTRPSGATAIGRLYISGEGR